VVALPFSFVFTFEGGSALLFSGDVMPSTIFQMAAAYGFHLCRNHPFIDGNKRVAGMAMFTFLKLNGLEPVATEADCYATIIAVATGQVSKEQIAAWLETVASGTAPDITTE
jgi:death-on-curing protein